VPGFWTPLASIYRYAKIRTYFSAKVSAALSTPPLALALPMLTRGWASPTAFNPRNSSSPAIVRLFIEREVLLCPSNRPPVPCTVSVPIEAPATGVDVDVPCRENTSTREDTYEMEDCRRAALRALIASLGDTPRAWALVGGVPRLAGGE
jgi:hypothetical protein